MISDLEFRQRLERAVAMAQAPIRPRGFLREVIQPIFPLLLEAGRQFYRGRRMRSGKV